DVGDVLHPARQRAERVVGAAEAGLRDGGAFERRKKNSPEAVADRGAEAAFERLGGKFSVRVGGSVLVTNDARREFQPAPTDSHDCCSLCPCRIAGSSRPDQSGPSVFPPRRRRTLMLFCETVLPTCS